MKKIFYSLTIALMASLCAGAAVPAKTAVASDRLQPTAKVGVDRQALNAVANPYAKIERMNRASVKNVKRKAVPTAKDFAGMYAWSGNSLLDGSAGMGESGIMNIVINENNPDELLITGFPDVSTGEGRITLNAYVKDGRLCIPNQYLFFNTYYDEDVWFINETVRNDNSEGEEYYRFVDSGIDFYFTMTEDGNLVAGTPVDQEKWDAHKYTDAELEEMVCFAAAAMPEYRVGWFWLLNDVEAKRNSFFEYNPDEWNFEGMATFSDAWFRLYWENFEAPVYEVEAYSNKKNPNLYMLLDPYGKNTPYGEFDINISDRQGYLVFDISNPECVMFRPFVYSMTLDMGDGEATEFYCYNSEGYYYYLNGKNKEEIIDDLNYAGYEVSYYETQTRTVGICNAGFDMGQNFGNIYVWTETPMTGYIILPERKGDNPGGETPTPPTGDFVVPAPFVNQSVTPGKTATFDVLLASEEVLTALEGANQKVNNWLVNDENRNLYIWDGTFTSNFTTYPGVGYNDYRYDEYVSLNVAGYQGWSGAGFHILSPGLNTMHWTDETRLHIAYRTDGNAPASVAFIIADADGGMGSPARIAVGENFNDNGNIYPSVGSGLTNEWKAIDISLADIKKFDPGFSYVNTTSWEGNILSFLAGGVEGTNISLDAIYFYTPEADEQEPEPTPAGTYTLCGENIDGGTQGTFYQMDDQTYVWSGTVMTGNFYIERHDTHGVAYLGSYGNDISLNSAYPLAESVTENPIGFNGFDLLVNPIILLNTGNSTITILQGTPYVEGENAVEYPEMLYINGRMPMENLGGGIYMWKGESLSSGFIINDGKDTPVYTIGSAGNILLLNEEYDYVAGLGSKGIEIMGGDMVEDVTLTVNLNSWQILLEGTTSGADMIEDAEARSTYYDLNGIKVENPEKGVYIKVTDGEVTKVII